MSSGYSVQKRDHDELSCDVIQLENTLSDTVLQWYDRFHISHIDCPDESSQCMPSLITQNKNYFRYCYFTCIFFNVSYTVCTPLIVSYEYTKDINGVLPSQTGTPFIIYEKFLLCSNFSTS